MFIVQIPGSSSAAPLTESMIRAACGFTAQAAGRSYEARGRVIECKLSEDGRQIEARTIGSRSEPYSQLLTIKDRPLGEPALSGRCSCPVRVNCKHCAAAAYAAMHARGPRSSLDRPARPLATPATPPKAARADDPLPPRIAMWLDSLQSTAEDEGETYPQGVKQRLLYVLAPDASHPGVPTLAILPFTGTVRKDGSYGALRQYPPSNVQNNARFLRPSDRLVLQRLLNRTGYRGQVSAEEMDDTLRRILETGRARWETCDNVPLVLGQPRPAQIGWAMGVDGSQRATLSLEPGLVAVRNPTPWYVDPESSVAGPLTLDLPPGLVSRLLAAPPIPAESAARVRAEIARRLPSVPVPPPFEPGPATRLTERPRPRLRLAKGMLPFDESYRGYRWGIEPALRETAIARLSHEYGPISVPYAALGEQPRLFRLNGTMYEPRRDRQTEMLSLERLGIEGFGRVGDVLGVHFRHAHSDDFVLLDPEPDHVWPSFMLDAIPRLRADGWIVEVDEDFPYRVIGADAVIDARLESASPSANGGGSGGGTGEGSGIDWLELHVGVQIDGKEIDLLPPLLSLLRQRDLGERLAGAQGGTVMVPLPGGQRLALPLDRLRPTLEALIELHSTGLVDTDARRVGFSRLDAAALAGVEARAGVIWRGGEALRSLGQKLRDAGDAIPRAVVPDTFKGTLRAYQSQGVDWLQFLASAGLGGVLADDMGLGKTVQTLAHIAIEKAAGRLTRPALIVCPTSLIPNWRDEATRFAPGLTVLVLHGTGRQKLFGRIADHDVVLTTYPLLARDHEALTPLDWHMVVLDEAQTIKNPTATTTRQAVRLKAQQRLCLSGTPLQNHLGELWSLFDFLAPGFLGSQTSFRSRYRTPIEKNGDAARSEALARRVRPFLLRRTKEEVATELPPKTEITERVEMEGGQRAVYEAIRLSMHTRVQAAIAQKGLARSGIVILDALLKMRQACCDPRLLKLPSTSRNKAGSAKLDRLMEMLGVMLAEGRRILLFSQFTEMLALIEARLAADGVGYVLLTGDTKDRASPVKRFQAGEVPLFLISLKAGGVGLNLTAADTVIHYDPWWNPAAEDQATDRAHRIGQQKAVFVHRLVTLGTIEEKMEVLKEKKRALVASVMEAEHGGALRLTEADVAELFGTG